MTLFKAIIMGIVQGVTEFLPVSSSGHLAIFKNILGIQTDLGMVFDIMLHLGTLLAVSIVYFSDIKRLAIEGIGILGDCMINVITFFQNVIQKKDKEYRRIISKSYRKFVMLVIVSTIPTAIVGYSAVDLVEMSSDFLIIPGICLIITGVLLLIADFVPQGEKTPKQVTYTNAFLLGIAQGIATLPGISRSGTTITACLLSKFDRRFAVKYSFIMSIPAILGASVLQLKDIGSEAVSSTEMIYYLVGSLISSVVGYICIKTMLVIVRNKKFKFFAIYCFLIGIFSIGGFIYLK